MEKVIKLQVGKNGLTDEFIEQAKQCFEKTHFLKVHILKSACRGKEEAKKMADKLVESLGDKFNYKLIGYTLNIRKFRKTQR
jgi:RNA-binding protein YhbY